MPWTALSFDILAKSLNILIHTGLILGLGLVLLRLFGQKL
jgi:hypothetical protein